MTNNDAPAGQFVACKPCQVAFATFIDGVAFASRLRNFHRRCGRWCCRLRGRNSGTYSLHGGSSDASRNLSLRLWEQPKTCHVFQLSLRIYTKRTTAFGRCLLVQQKAMSQSTCRRLLCFHARFRIACLAQSTTMASTHLQLHHLAHLSFYLNAVKTSKNKKNNE